MYAIRYRLRDAWEFCKRVLRPIWNLTRWAAIAAVLALFYQAIATAMQAEALAWDTLGSPSSVGHLGKVNALKHLNKDSTIPIPIVAGLFGLEEGEEYWFGRVDDRQTLRMPGPLYFRGRTNLQGIDLSLGHSFEAGCPEQLNVLQGVKLADAMLSHSNFECADFVGPRPAQGLLLHSNGRRIDGADFSGARLTKARFSGAMLDFSDLKSADLQGARFYGASLVGVRFDGANANGAMLKEVRFDLPKSRRVGPQTPSFPNCPNAHACFVAACLQGAEIDLKPSWRPISLDFRGAALSNAKIAGQIVSAKFGRIHHEKDGEKTEQDLNPSLLRSVFDFLGNSDKTDVSVCIATKNGVSKSEHSTKPEAGIVDPSLRAADLSQATLTDVVWERTDFRGASLDGAKLMGADLSTAKFDSTTQLDTACIDDFTILPKGFTRQSRKESNVRCPKSKPTVEGPLRNQGLRLSVIPKKFVGKVVAFNSGVFQIEVGDDQLEFVDVSVQMGLNSFGAFGEDERTRVEEHLKEWVGNTRQDIRCVSFPLKAPLSDDSSDKQGDNTDPQEVSAEPRGTGSSSAPAATSAAGKETKLRVRTTRYGWCALPDDKNRNVSQHRFADVVLKEAHKVLNTEKAITPASNTQGQRTP